MNSFYLVLRRDKLLIRVGHNLDKGQVEGGILDQFMLVSTVEHIEESPIEKWVGSYEKYTSLS